ncbi:hypothetical protein LZK76_15020 [Rhizobium leguminosarum]|nr:hypothetical protein LZK76_15020 [Rhizobium leguminosarum]
MRPISRILALCAAIAIMIAAAGRRQPIRWFSTIMDGRSISPTPRAWSPTGRWSRPSSGSSTLSSMSI